MVLHFDESVTGALDPFYYAIDIAWGGPGPVVTNVVYNAGSNQVILRLDAPLDTAVKYGISFFGFPNLQDYFGNPLPDGFSVSITSPRGFRQDASGYVGTVDTEIHSNNQADTSLGTNTVVTVDLDDSGVAQSLLRFNGIFGGGPGQVPACSTYITHGILRLYTVDLGTTVRMLRLKRQWDGNSTWNSLQSGIDQPDEVETNVAERLIDTSQPFAYVEVDVAKDLQDWAWGAPNYGWVFLATSGNGWDFASSENPTPEFRPSLEVEFAVSHEPCSIITQPQSVTIREGEPFTLSVLARGTDSMYQWFKNNMAIPGATNRTYSIAQAILSDQGVYRVETDSDCTGPCISQNAVVTVRCAPNLRIAYQPANRVTLSWNPCGGTLQYADALGA